VPKRGLAAVAAGRSASSHASAWFRDSIAWTRQQAGTTTLRARLGPRTCRTGWRAFLRSADRPTAYHSRPQFKFELVAQRNAEHPDQRNLVFELFASRVDCPRAKRREDETPSLVEAERFEIVIGSDEPQPLASRNPWGAQTRSSCKDTDSAATADVTACGTDHAEKLRG